MSPRFSEILADLPLEKLLEASNHATSHSVDRVLKKGRACSLEDFALLLSPTASNRLEEMARLSQQTTRKHFGKVVRLFAPLYLSNECVNICKYCGFSRNNKIPRQTLPIQQVVEETRLLARQGFRSLLLVAGEHPRFVSNGYIEGCIRECLKHMPSILIEVAPMETEPYRSIVDAGCEGLVVYQETYNREIYREMHPHGPKKNFDWRLDTAERGYEAGCRRLGIGALFGLHDWREEALVLAAHARHLGHKCCNAQISISFPRLRPASGGFEPKKRNVPGDRDLVQLVSAMRLLIPHTAFVLSTREKPEYRDGLIPIGITNMSAGSSTEPGGYSHFEMDSWKPRQEQPGEQFHIADERTPAEIAEMIREKGYEPVWKDFDATLVSSEKSA